GLFAPEFKLAPCLGGPGAEDGVEEAAVAEAVADEGLVGADRRAGLDDGVGPGAALRRGFDEAPEGLGAGHGVEGADGVAAAGGLEDAAGEHLVHAQMAGEGLWAGGLVGEGVEDGADGAEELLAGGEDG